MPIADPPSLGRRFTLLGATTLTVMSGATIAPSLPALAAHFADVPTPGSWCASC